MIEHQYPLEDVQRLIAVNRQLNTSLRNIILRQTIVNLRLELICNSAGFMLVALLFAYAVVSWVVQP